MARFRADDDRLQPLSPEGGSKGIVKLGDSSALNPVLRFEEPLEPVNPDFETIYRMPLVKTRGERVPGHPDENSLP